MKKYSMNMILLFITALLQMACTKNATETVVMQTAITTPVDSNTKSFLALGDSYTIGQSVNVDERFPAQTAALLKAINININPLQYIAVTGWTTNNLQNAITATKPQAPFDVVTLLIGVNDEYQGLDTAGYRIRFEQLLQTSIALAGNKISHVFVLSIPDYSVTPFASGSDTKRISAEIDSFNAINKQITLKYNISYVDITPISRQAATDKSLIANDGLHPSAQQYKLWVDLLEPLVAKVLK